MACKSFHKGKYYVTFKRGFEDCKRDITVSIDKVFESDCLKISLSDDEDPTFLCVLNVTRFDYEELKKQQGLLIDFDNFPSQLVRLLQQCASNNMFLIMQQTNPVQFYFEIVEHNEFKRLIHLSLKTCPATDADIKHHMAQTILNLKKTLGALKCLSSSNEAILNDKCINMERKINDLSHALTKMEEDKLRRESEHQETLKQEKDRLVQEKLQWQKNAEVNSKAQLVTSQENLTKKDKQIDELNSICNHLRDTVGHLENKISEKSQRLNVLEKEVQKSHIEVATLTAKNSSLERDFKERGEQYTLLHSRYANLEKIIKDNSETIKELTNSLNLIKKEKISLEERLALSESLSHKHNEAVHSTTEQLLKANQIISKQNIDLIEMKEKLLCRTAIALEQEKVIEKSTKEIEDLKSEVLLAKENVDKFKTELSSLAEKLELNEKTLKDKDEIIKNNNMVIQWLHKKMEDGSGPSDMLLAKTKVGRPSPGCSTPYFQPRKDHTNLSEGHSEESINFYATSKLSDEENSPRSEPQERSNKAGLHPKYLKPAVEDNKTQPKNGVRTKSNDQVNQKGKENKNYELPKVDYKEKKSSRGNTYRPTPVSAYFLSK